jgi:hypothetical protein
MGHYSDPCCYLRGFQEVTEAKERTVCSIFPVCKLHLHLTADFQDSLIRCLLFIIVEGCRITSLTLTPPWTPACQLSMKAYYIYLKIWYFAFVFSCWSSSRLTTCNNWKVYSCMQHWWIFASYLMFCGLQNWKNVSVEWGHLTASCILK